MKIGKTSLLALLGFCFAMTGCKGFCSNSSSTCGVSDVDDSKITRISSIKWSPDGKKLAFNYRNGDFAPNTNYSLYTVNADGTKLKKLLETHVEHTFYIIYQWATNNKILTGDYNDLYDIDEQGLVKKIFSQPNERVNGYYYEIKNACHLSDARYVIVQSSLPFPGWIDVLNTETGTIVSANISQTNPFRSFMSNWGSLGIVECLPVQNMLYLSQLNTSVAQNKFEAYFTVGKIIPEMAEIEDITVFKSFDSDAEHKEVPELRYLGVDTKNNFIYSSLEQKQVNPTILSYNLESKETRKRQDIKILGDFSPNLQKVAFLDYDKPSRDYNLAISNLDGSQKQVIVKAQDIPKGTLPE